MKIPYRFKRRTLKLLRLLRRQKRQIAVIGCLSLLLALLLTHTHITINQTPSLYYRAFICINGLSPNRGDFVSIINHSTSYFEKIHYTKRLIGFPGDKLLIHNNQIYIIPTCLDKMCNDNHKLFLIGPLQKATQDGSLLQPNKIAVVPHGPVVSQRPVVPQGHVFVSGDHPRSFDSRYEEFGLVREEHLSGRCFGLWPLPVISNQSSVIRKVSLPEKQSIKGEK